jgi:hypothetical protein
LNNVAESLAGAPVTSGALPELFGIDTLGMDTDPQPAPIIVTVAMQAAALTVLSFERIPIRPLVGPR